MKVHSNQKIEELKKLRKLGYSIPELVEKLSVPKTTVWHHVHSVKVLPQYRKSLLSKRGGSHQRMLKRTELAQKLAQELYGSKNWHPAVVLSMLYWAEGSKRDFCFTNTDASMIVLFLQILKDVFKIKDSELYFVLRITDKMNQESCLKHWSDNINIPSSNFKVRINDGVKNMKSDYGIFRIFVRKGRNLLKLVNAILEIEKRHIKSL